MTYNKIAPNRNGWALLLFFLQVFVFCCLTATYVTLRFVDIQHLTYLRKQSFVAGR